jgi:serine O-acetyltransferase
MNNLVVAVYRLGRWGLKIRQRRLRKLFFLAYHILYTMTKIVSHIDLPCETEIGDNLQIEHACVGGITVTMFSKLGNNVVLRQGVTIGLRLREGDEPIGPLIGNNVDLGCGCCVLGPITIGDNVQIGANAVVITDVPSNSIAVGVPAVVKPRRPGPLKQPTALDLEIESWMSQPW